MTPLHAEEVRLAANKAIEDGWFDEFVAQMKSNKYDLSKVVQPEGV